MGFNSRGYRGPVLGPKPEGGHRVAILGGSTAAGYGVRADQTLPAFLGQVLAEKFPQSEIDVANLGWNVQGVFSFPFTIESYKYLQPDLWIFYIGYTDAGINTSDWRKESVCFRFTGYMPIWPLIFREKAMSLMSGGQLDRAYRDPKIIFSPSLTARITGTALHGTVDAMEGMGQILEAWAKQGGKAENTKNQKFRTEDPLAFYLYWVDTSVEKALSLSKGSVLLLGQPRIGEWHARQQKALHKHFLEKYADNPRVFYEDFASAIDLRNVEIAPDGMHLSVLGNRILADKLCPVVGQILQLPTP